MLYNDTVELIHNKSLLYLIEIFLIIKMLCSKLCEIEEDIVMAGVVSLLYQVR